MANKTITMQKIRQILRLKQDGTSNRKTGLMLGLHRETVRKYVNQVVELGMSYELLLKEDDSVLENIFEKHKFPKPNKDRLERLHDFFPKMEKELSRVGVDKWNLWSEYKELEADGYAYSHFCRAYNFYNQKQQVSAHFEQKSGDKLYVDYTGSKLHIVDKHTGEIKAVEVLVAVLGHSHYTYVEATLSQKKEDFITAIENALHYFQGVPKAIVTDNLKSAVTRSCKYEPQLNETFESFALHYATTILPTRAYKPKDKAIVEGAVNIVYRRIFAPLRDITFFSLRELNAAIKEQLEKYNSINFKGKDHSRKILFEQVEKNELDALPLERFELRSYNWQTVHKNSHIFLTEDKHYYSVPFKHISQKVKVVYSGAYVEIYAHHSRIAAHRRDRKSYGYTTEKDHMPSTHRFVSEWNPERFLSWAKSIGEPTRHIVEKILDNKSHPEQAYKACLGVLGFAKKVGNDRLNNACSRAVYYQSYGYHIIKKILDKGLDKEPVQLEIACTIPVHENVRGQSYYQ